MIARFLLVVLVSAGFSAAAAAQTPPVPAELLAYPNLILVNGQVLTVDPQFTVAEAVAVRDGRILAVGSTADIRRLAGPATRVIDLAGRSVVPGFIDSDGDNAFAGGDLYKDTMINGKIGQRTRGDSVAVLLQQVRDLVTTAAPGSPVFVRMADEWINELSKLTRKDADTLAPNNPASDLMHRRPGLIPGIFLVVLASAAAAQDVPQLNIGRLTGEDAPQIDGRVDESTWSAAEPFTAFVQQEPNEGAPASERTEVRFLIGRGTLYIAVICYDSSPGEIVVSESRRDAALADTDSIEILLDTFDDGQNAFVFGTNPFGIELDGQVMGEGQTAAGGMMQSGVGGSQRGAFRGFNANWDADWTVRAQTTERGWEAEFAIPLRTLRYNAGDERTWGVNVMRNIRRKNEQVFLSPVPRGYSLYRVSSAGKLHGLTLPARRDLRFLPYASGSVNDDKTLGTGAVDRTGRLGLDFKWGVRADLTFDATVNTDFAQVEADEEQVNLTRFALFFPEKRPFFLENAQLFQVGQPQAIDLFFSRRIGFASSGQGAAQSGQPIDILGGARLSGNLGGGYKIGLLNLQTDDAVDARSGRTLAASNNFTVVRLQREIGRSNFGGIVVNRLGVGAGAPRDDFNRAYAVDAAWQATTNSRLFAFLARTDSPDRKGGSDYAGRLYYNYAGPIWSSALGYSQVGERFNPEVGFLQRKAYRRIESRYGWSYQPKRWPSIRRLVSSLNYNVYMDLANRLESTYGHMHAFEIQPLSGGRITAAVDFSLDRPLRLFTAYQDVTGRRVIIPPGEYASWTGGIEYISDPSAPLNVSLQSKNGRYYDGDHFGWEFLLGARVGARFLTSWGWNRDEITLPFGRFKNDLVPLNVGYSFTSRASLQGLIQYNRQTSTISSNVRLALLNRSGTGLFAVYNDRRDTNLLTPEELLGRSFIVKYTRLVDF